MGCDEVTAWGVGSGCHRLALGIITCSGEVSRFGESGLESSWMLLAMRPNITVSLDFLLGGGWCCRDEGVYHVTSNEGEGERGNFRVMLEASVSPNDSYRLWDLWV